MKTLDGRPLPPELDHDPVWQAALRAPVVEETPDEKAFMEYLRTLGGPSVSGAEVTAEIQRRAAEAEAAEAAEAECAAGK